MQYWCDACDGNFANANFCFDCYCCSGCCRCARPKFFESKLTFHNPTKKQMRTNSSECYISAEIEVASIDAKYKRNIEDVVKKWKGSIVYDGTLPNATGFEINTAPASGDLYIKQVTEICKVLKTAKAKVTNDCGLHVHLNATDFNYADIAKLIKLYAAIEPALFAMVPGHRRNSEFAIRCGDKLANVLGNPKSHLELKERVVTAVYGYPNTSRHWKNKRGAGHGTGRYYALNLHSWFYRGTVECRLFEGTINKDDIIDLGMMWAGILDFVLLASSGGLSKALDKRDPLKILLAITKSKRVKSFINRRYKRYSREPTPKPKLAFDELFAI